MKISRQSAKAVEQLYANTLDPTILKVLNEQKITYILDIRGNLSNLSIKEENIID